MPRVFHFLDGCARKGGINLMLDFLFSSALAEGEAAAVTSQPNWLQAAFGKFGELSLKSWIALLVLVILGVGLLAISRSKAKWSPKMLAYAALSIALSFVLSYIRLLKMGQGGSVTPASMLPIMLFAYAFGAAPGILAGVAYSLLQFIQDSWMLNVWQFLLDYPIAFGMIGLVGLFRGKAKLVKIDMSVSVVSTGKTTTKSFKVDVIMLVGILIASIGRFIASTMSGVVFFAENAPKEISPLLYSFFYNGSYMLPEMVICMLIAIIAAPRLMRIMKAM